MSINWKVRLKNPLFWVQVIVAVVMPALVGVGLNWADMTSWGALGNAMMEAVKNPVVVVSMVVSVFNAVTDPTTEGIGDSERAMEYQEPGK